MKTKIYSLLLAIIASTGTILASITQVGGIWYDFNSTMRTASVTYRGSSYDFYSNEYSGSVIIPASVIYNNVTYSVTKIGDDAFNGCTSLKSVTIPSSVTRIGMRAFSGCSNLTDITCLASNPPTCYASFPYITNKSFPVYVLKGSLNAYKTADEWKDFTNYQSTTDDQYACSSTSMTITFITVNPISRWEQSYDGGNTWANIAYKKLPIYGRKSCSRNRYVSSFKLR